MNNDLTEAAFRIAREQYKKCEHAISSDLSKIFSDEGFDTIHTISERAVQLHIASMEIAAKVHDGFLSDEKASEILGNQFGDFSPATISQAMGLAGIDTR